MAGEKILIVDDEIQICEMIRYHLDKEQYVTHMAHDAAAALELLEEVSPNLILLDIMLPDMNGTDLCLEIRRKTQCPILFLSCKAEEIDKIIAFSAGGDDYVTKPFLAGELMARIKAHLRRNRMLNVPMEKNQVYEYEGLRVDLAAHQVFLDEDEVLLTPKEFDILALLLENSKRIFSIEQIFEHVWKTDSITGDSKTIMVYISNIRKKIEPEGRKCKYIINVRGVGYKFNSNLKGGALTG